MNPNIHYLLSHLTVNATNIDDRCFQYAFTLTQSHKEINIHPEPSIKY